MKGEGEEHGVRQRSGLAELDKHSVDRVERGVYLFSDLKADAKTKRSVLCSVQVKTIKCAGYPGTKLRNADAGEEQRQKCEEQLFTFAPVSTILPETKMSKTTLGLIMR